MKQASFYVFLVVATLLSIEVLVRLLLATQLGPRVLLYGTPWHRRELAVKFTAPEDSVQFHENTVGDYRAYREDDDRSYAKYFPHEKRFTQARSGHARYPVRINNHGFRGDDFEIAKKPGTLRVLTLGASSTFGYRNRDHETYPYALERILNEETGGRPAFEVINFAIAHAITHNIVSIFLTEGVALDPDFVTLYAGANDSSILDERQSLARQASVLAELASHLLGRLVRTEEVYWSEEYAEHRSRVYLANVQRLREECERRGIVFVVASQQTTALQPEQRRDFSYRDEVALVRDRIASGQPKQAGGSSLLEDPLRHSQAALEVMLDPARILLIHSRLMQDLEQWASTTNVDYVDVIEVLDAHRELLISWVHLAPQANRMVAQALSNAILRHVRAAEPAPAAPGSARSQGPLKTLPGAPPSRAVAFGS